MYIHSFFYGFNMASILILIISGGLFVTKNEEVYGEAYKIFTQSV